MCRSLLYTLTLAAAQLLCAATLYAQHASLGVVVIDAGHGGPNYPGASRKLAGRTVYEKDINLGVALKLGKLIEENLDGVKVVYTRKSDKQLAPTLKGDLQARADIANEAGGNLFISIHANAAKSTAARGTVTLVMGESDFEVGDNGEAIYQAYKEELIDMSDAKTAATVRAYIQTLQFTFGQYSRTFAELVQKHYKSSTGHGNRRVGVGKQLLKVLYATNMPGVLTEIGFMSNPDELRYIASQSGQQQIARSIFNAVSEYKKLIDSRAAEAAAAESGQQGQAAQASEQPQQGETDQAEGQAEGQVGFTIQLCASKSRIAPRSAEFKSLRGKTQEYIARGTFRYKYCTGRYATRAEAEKALGRIKKEFKGAYVVGYRADRLIGADEAAALLKQGK